MKLQRLVDELLSLGEDDWVHVCEVASRRSNSFWNE